MEAVTFLAFVNGAIALTAIYYTYSAIVVKKQYEDMLGMQGKLQNQQSMENAELREKINDLEIAIFDVDRAMEEDKYKDVAAQARKVVAIEQVVEKHAKQLALNEGSRKEMYEAISRVNQKLKTFGDDPTLVRGY